MTKKSLIKVSSALLFGMLLGGMTACDNDGGSAPKKPSVADIPSDALATPNPEVGEITGTMPNIQYSVTEEEGVPVIRLDMTGVQDPETMEWLHLYGTGESEQNIWVEVDGVPKGIKVYNTADDSENNHVVPVDMVFLVDNSGSMSEEADAVARDIITWASLLESSGLNIRFGCVGYDGEINGAINITSVEELSTWLNKSTGTSRTRKFGGDDADRLSRVTEPYRTGGGSANECGMAALRYANDNFTFRANANRIYINFTDEPNQPNYNEEYSVEWLPENWTTEMGTIHTVYSEDPNYYNYYDLYQELNDKMSEYTGGTILYTDPYFNNVTLMNLPVSAAMQNSYIIRFTNVQDFLDGLTHEIKITIISSDGSVQVERTFTVNFGNGQQ